MKERFNRILANFEKDRQPTQLKQDHHSLEKDVEEDEDLQKSEEQEQDDEVQGTPITDEYG